jgi:hypothetical protein
VAGDWDERIPVGFSVGFVRTGHHLRQPFSVSASYTGQNFLTSNVGYLPIKA